MTDPELRIRLLWELNGILDALAVTCAVRLLRDDIASRQLAYHARTQNARKKEAVNMRLYLRRRREKSGLSMREVARRLGVSNPSYCNWETGKALPTADKLPAIADLFGCSIDDLYAPDADPPNDTSLTEEVRHTMESESRNIYRTGRQVAGLTQERWAEAISVSVDSVRNYEAGTQTPSDEVVRPVSRSSGPGHLARDPRRAAKKVPRVGKAPAGLVPRRT